MANYLKLRYVFICLFICAFNTTFVLSCENCWTNFWVKGQEAMRHQDYPVAIEYFSQSLNRIDPTDNHFLFVFNDRGAAYLDNQQYQEAILDFSHVIQTLSSEINADKIKAYWGRAKCYARLNMLPEFTIDYEIIREIDPNYPKVDISDKYLVIRNIHTNAIEPKLKDAFFCVMAKANICDKKEDITFYESSVLIRRKDPCSASKAPCRGCEDKKQTVVITASINTDYWDDKRKEEEEKQRRIDKCKENCASAAIAAGWVCSRVPSYYCQGICYGAVEALRRTCNWCCETNSWYDNCIRPLERFVPEPCNDPLFPDPYDPWRS